MLISNETEDYVNHYTEGDMTTGEHMTDQPPNMEVLVPSSKCCVEVQCLCLSAVLAFHSSGGNGGAGLFGPTHE